MNPRELNIVFLLCTQAKGIRRSYSFSADPSAERDEFNNGEVSNNKKQNQNSTELKIIYSLYA
jgi:hypothetical protein